MENSGQRETDSSPNSAIEMSKEEQNQVFNK